MADISARLCLNSWQKAAEAERPRRVCKWQRQGKRLTDLFHVNKENLCFWLCSQWEEEKEDVNARSTVQHPPTSLPFTISLNRCILTLEEGVNPSCATWSICMRSVTAKSFAERKRFVIPLPHSLHSLRSIPSAEVLPRQRSKKCNRFEEKNRRQLLESDRSCWDAFSPPEENPVVFLAILPAPQVRQILGLFLYFQNNYGQLKKKKDDVPSSPAAQVPQTNPSFTWNLCSLHEPRQTSSTESHKQRKVKENPRRDCIPCSWNRSSISTLLLTLNTNICPC